MPLYIYYCLKKYQLAGPYQEQNHVLYAYWSELLRLLLNECRDRNYRTVRTLYLFERDATLSPI